MSGYPPIGGAGGSNQVSTVAAIDEDMFFSTIEGRDIWTQGHPEALYNGIACAVGSSPVFDYYMWDKAAGTWRAANLIYQGDKGDRGEKGERGEGGNPVVSQSLQMSSKTLEQKTILEDGTEIDSSVYIPYPDPSQLVLAKDQAVMEAKVYTDDKFEDAENYTDEEVAKAKPKDLETTVSGQTLTSKITLGDNTELTATATLPSTGGGGVTDTYTKAEIDQKDQAILTEAKTYTDQHSGGGGGSFDVPDDQIAIGKDGALVGAGVSIVDGKISLAPNSLGIGHHTYSSAGEKSLLQNESNASVGAILMQDDVDGSVELIRYTSSALEYIQGQSKSQDITNPEFSLQVVDFGFYKIDAVEAEIEFTNMANSTVLLQFFSLDELISTNRIEPSIGLKQFTINPLYLSGASDITVKISQVNGEDVVVKGDSSRPYFKFSYRTYDTDYAATETLLQDEVLGAKPRRLESSISGQTLTTKLSFINAADDLTATVVLPNSGGGTISGDTLDIGYKRISPADEETLLTDLNTLSESILLKSNLSDGKVEVPVFEQTQTFTQGQAKTENIVNPEFTLRGVVGQGYYMIDTDFQIYMQYAQLPTSNIKLEIFRDDTLIHTSEFTGTATGTPSDVPFPRLFIAAETPIKIKMTLVDGTDLTVVGSDGVPFLEMPYKPYVLRDIAAASSGEGNPVASVEHNVNSEGLETLITLQDGTPITSNRVPLETSDPKDLKIDFVATVQNVINANAGVCYSYDNAAVVRPYSSLFDVSLMGVALETVAQGDIKVAVRGVFDVVNLDISDRSEGEVMYYGDDNMLGFTGEVGDNQHPIGLYLGGATLFLDVDVYNRSKDIAKARQLSEFELLKADTIVAIDKSENFLALNASDDIIMQSAAKTIIRGADSVDLEVGSGNKVFTLAADKISSSLAIDLNGNSIENLPEATESSDAVNLGQVQTLIAQSGGTGGGGSGDVSWAGDLTGNESKILLGAGEDGKTIKSSQYYEADLTQMIADVNGNGEHIQELQGSLSGILDSVSQNTNRIGATEGKLDHREFPQVTTLESLGITREQINAAGNKSAVAQLFFSGSVESAEHHKYVLRLNIESGDTLNGLLPNSEGGLLVVSSVETQSLHRVAFDFFDVAGGVFVASKAGSSIPLLDFIQLGAQDLTELEDRVTAVERSEVKNRTDIVEVGAEQVEIKEDVAELQNLTSQTSIKVNRLIDATYDRPHLDSIESLNLTDESFANASTPQDVLEVFRQSPYLGGFATWELTIKTADNYHGLLPESGGFFVIHRFDSLLYAQYYAESGKVYVASIATDNTFHDWKDTTAEGGGDNTALESRVKANEDAVVAQDLQLAYLNTFSTNTIEDLDITAAEVQAAVGQEQKALLFHNAEIGGWDGAPWRLQKTLDANDNFYGFLDFTALSPGLMLVERYADVDGRKTTQFTYISKLVEDRWIMDDDATFQRIQTVHGQSGGGTGGGTAELETKVNTNTQTNEIQFEISKMALVNAFSDIGMSTYTETYTTSDRARIAGEFAAAKYTSTKDLVTYESNDYQLNLCVHGDTLVGFLPLNEASGVLTVTKVTHPNVIKVKFDFVSEDGVRFEAYYNSSGEWKEWFSPSATIAIQNETIASMQATINTLNTIVNNAFHQQALAYDGDKLTSTMTRISNQTSTVEVSLTALGGSQEVPNDFVVYMGWNADTNFTPDNIKNLSDTQNGRKSFNASKSNLLSQSYEANRPSDAYAYTYIAYPKDAVSPNPTQVDYNGQPADWPMVEVTIDGLIYNVIYSPYENFIQEIEMTLVQE